MCPDIERFIGQLEEAEDAVSGWAARVSVAWDDAVLMEHLNKTKPRVTAQLANTHSPHSSRLYLDTYGEEPVYYKLNGYDVDIFPSESRTIHSWGESQWYILDILSVKNKHKLQNSVPLKFHVHMFNFWINWT